HSAVLLPPAPSAPPAPALLRFAFTVVHIFSSLGPLRLSRQLYPFCSACPLPCVEAEVVVLSPFDPKKVYRVRAVLIDLNHGRGAPILFGLGIDERCFYIDQLHPGGLVKMVGNAGK